VAVALTVEATVEEMVPELLLELIILAVAVAVEDLTSMVALVVLALLSFATHQV
jgi:hypothetical protein